MSRSATFTFALMLSGPATQLACATPPDNNFDKLKAAERQAAATREAIANPALAVQDRAALKQQLAQQLQDLGTLQTFAGAPETALDTFDSIGPMLSGRQPGGTAAPEPARDPEIDAAVAADAVEAIVAQARKHQIVILNESHHVPLHRAFAMVLARELRKIGYTHLAAETLYAAPLAKGYPTQQTGYYSAEPVFANFLRDARRVKWTLVPYEHEHSDDGVGFAEQMRLREAGQVDNLVKRVLSRDPKAKIFMYVGYDHLKEKPGTGTGADQAWMAAVLRQRTGIDPLTIDQTTLFAHRLTGGHPLYPQAAAKNASGKPFVLRTGARYQVVGQYKGQADMQVVHPAYPVSAATGRPEWMSTLAGWQARPIPKELWPTTGRRVIYARRKGAPADELPVDAVLAVAGSAAPMIMAPPGELAFSVSD